MYEAYIPRHLFVPLDPQYILSRKLFNVFIPFEYLIIFNIQYHGTTTHLDCAK